MACPKCDASEGVQILYGRGYYLKCPSCGQNSSLKVDGRVRKQGPQFFLVASDGSERLLHVNA